MSLKNKYFGIIYKGCIANDPVRKIHKALYDATINTKAPYRDKVLLAFAIKLTNKAKKVGADGTGLLAIALLNLFKKDESNAKAKKIINHQVSVEAEKEKLGQLDQFIDKSRDKGEWFYLASSHNDCAKDHKPYQGRLYVDAKAPKEIIDYAHDRGLYTLQWVMDAPAYFITRPNCRHYFVSLSIDQVRGQTLKVLRKRHHTHSKVGNRDFQTPPKAAVEEYEDRLKMLRELYRQYPTESLKAEILKTKLLLDKWKKLI